MPRRPLGASLTLGGLTVCGMLTLGPSAAAAQALRPFVGVSAGSFNVRSDLVDGRSASVSVLGGLAMSRYVDVELELAFPTDAVTRSDVAQTVSCAPAGASREQIERMAVVAQIDRSRQVDLSASAVAIIHPPFGRRLTPALVAGVTNQWTQDRTVSTPLVVPPGVDPRHPAVAARDERSRRNIGGPTIGGCLFIQLTDRFFVAPDLRFVYGSIGDEINNSLYTTIRAVWRF